MGKIARTVTAELGRGLLAGLIGTAAMTVSSTLEMKLRKRAPSRTPSQAAGKVLGVKPRDEDGEARFANLVHFGYGTAWGLARALLGVLGVRGRALAPLAHLAAVWGTEAVMLPALGVAPPVARWSARQIGIDLLHHAVYAGATDAAYRQLG